MKNKILSAGIGFGSVEPKTDQPKIVVGRLNGSAFCTVSLRDIMTEDIIIATPNAVGGAARPIGNWACLLEVEGVEGFEEFVCPPAHGQPMMTNGMGNQNHIGFQNNNKKYHFPIILSPNSYSTWWRKKKSR